MPFLDFAEARQLAAEFGTPLLVLAQNKLVENVEDLRTALLSDEQVRADPRFRGDGTGPRIDPRSLIFPWRPECERPGPSPRRPGDRTWAFDSCRSR